MHVLFCTQYVLYPMSYFVPKMTFGICAAAHTHHPLGMLRNLSGYYYKEPTLLFLVRVAQGLVHMGKGLMSLSPYHTDRQLLSSTLAQNCSLSTCCWWWCSMTALCGYLFYE